MTAEDTAQAMAIISQDFQERISQYSEIMSRFMPAIEDTYRAIHRVEIRKKLKGKRVKHKWNQRVLLNTPVRNSTNVFEPYWGHNVR